VTFRSTCPPSCRLQVDLCFRSASSEVQLGKACCTWSVHTYAIVHLCRIHCASPTEVAATPYQLVTSSDCNGTCCRRTSGNLLLNARRVMRSLKHKLRHRDQPGSTHRGLNRQLQADTCHRCCYADQKTSSATAEDDPVAKADKYGKARVKLKNPAQSSWTAKHAGADADTQSDFLSNLGEGQDYNINVDHGKCCHPLTNSIIMRAVIVRC